MGIPNQNEGGRIRLFEHMISLKSAFLRNKMFPTESRENITNQNKLRL